MEKITFITGNYGKYLEASHYFKGAADILMHECKCPEIQSDSLKEVAMFKAKSMTSSVNGKFFIDDSGLFIESLKGFPGVYSAFVKETIGIKGILNLMEGIKDRRAYFKCVIAYHDSGEFKIFRGLCPGMISEDIRGHGGFGFDPVFIPYGLEKTMAEMELDEKNLISHRGRCLSNFASYIKNY